MYTGSTLYIYNPLLESKYEFAMQIRRDNFELFEHLFKAGLKNSQKMVDLAKKS